MAGVRQVDIDRIAARFEPRLREAFLAAVAAAAGAVSIGAIADAVRQGAQEVFRVLRAAKVPEAAFNAVADVMVGAAQAAAGPTAASLSWRFDLPDPVAREWVFRTVNEQGWLRFGVDTSRTASQFTDWQSSAERIIRQAFMEGGHPYDTARLLRDGLSLNPQQLEAMGRYYAGLRQQGISGDALWRAVDRRAQQMIRRRAETIARTETLRAARQGRLETWRAAADEGVLEADRTFREWVAGGPNACEDCMRLNGRVIPFDADWSVEGVPSPEEGLHPNCTCSEVLTFDVAPNDPRLLAKAWVVKPLGEFADWDACVRTMTGRLGSKDAAERYCGKLQSLVEG